MKEDSQEAKAQARDVTAPWESVKSQHEVEVEFQLHHRQYNPSQQQWQK